MRGPLSPTHSSESQEIFPYSAIIYYFPFFAVECLKKSILYWSLNFQLVSGNIDRCSNLQSQLGAENTPVSISKLSVLRDFSSADNYSSTWRAPTGPNPLRAVPVKNVFGTP